MRSRDHHKADRFIKEAAKINAIRRLREEMIMDSIKHRDLQFGKIIKTSLIQIDYQKIDSMILSLINEASNNICNNICKETHLFFQKIIKENNTPNKKCYLFKNDDVTLAPNANIMIEKRQNAANPTCQKCKWTADETDLLIRLNKDFDGNMQKISPYFPKRTFRSIESKLNLSIIVEKKNKIDNSNIILIFSVLFRVTINNL